MVKGKPHLKFTGLVAWALAVDGSKWKQKLTTACRNDSTWRYRECVPMDPSDFDIEQHIIPYIPSVTPMKKKIKRDPDALSPEKVWKPSTQSKRMERGKQEVVAAKRFFQQRLKDCVTADLPCQAGIWLYRALCTQCEAAVPNFRTAMESSLEWASMPDMTRAISFILNVDIELPSEKCLSKSIFLQKCIQESLRVAECYDGV